MKKFTHLLTMLYFSSVICLAHAATSTVNILTWWGYLDYPWIPSYIQKKCHANISFDEYYDNQNFLERFQENHNLYDIIIFEAPSYKEIKLLLPSIASSTLHQHARKYNPIIKKHYLNQKYPHNIAYFFESMTGLLWNKKNIIIKNNTNIENSLQYTKNHFVIILDDPIYFYRLIRHNKKMKENFSYKSFQELLGKNLIIITNGTYRNIYKSPSFMLSYQWSGEAIKNYEHLNSKNKKNLSFSASPKYSFISSDLIAQLNKKPETICIANALASKDFITRLQKNTYYFSPYTIHKNIKDPFFKGVYIKYISMLPKLKWIKNNGSLLREKIKNQWDFIKMKTTVSLEKKTKQKTDTPL